MQDKSFSSLILTYKNKALLVYKQINSLDNGKQAWNLIVGTKNTQETFESAFEKLLQNEMGMKVDKVEFISESYYWAGLTDENVNQMKRVEGQLFSFFTLKELEGLLLTTPAREFVSRHGALLATASQ